MKHKFTSGTYRVDLDDLCGLCLYPDRINPKGPEDFSIWINPRLRGLARLDTIIHEAIHAEDPTMPEKDVLRMGTNIAKLVWRLGYRCSNSKRSTSS